MNTPHKPHPQFDLVLERIVDVPRHLVWAAWTTPEHLKKWFTPLPWQTVDCEIDLRPRTVMRSPEGKDFPNLGCYLEIIPQEKLIWTNALFPGFRPATKAEDNCFNGFFTAIISVRDSSHLGRGEKDLPKAKAGRPTERERRSPTRKTPKPTPTSASTTAGVPHWIS